MSPEPRPCSAETGVRLAQPEVPQPVGLGLGALVVDLVGGEHDRLVRLAQDLDDRLVGVGDPDRRVDHEQHRVGEPDRDLGLGRDPLGQAAGVGVPAAGVDDGEGAAVPVGVVGDPVAGHARHVLDDRLAAADDPVDQRGLADVGAADDGEDGNRAGVLGLAPLLGVVGGRGSVVPLGHGAPCSVTPVAGSGSTSVAGSGPGSSRPVVASAWSRWASMCSRSNTDACSTCSRVRGHGVGVSWYGAPNTMSTVARRGRQRVAVAAGRPGAEEDDRHDRRPRHQREVGRAAVEPLEVAPARRPSGKMPTARPSRSTRRQSLHGARVA